MNKKLLILLATSGLLAACERKSASIEIVGQLESDRIELTAEFAEPVIERLVAEGEQVAAGDLVLQQDPARARTRLREGEASLALSQARLDQLIEGPRKEQIQAAQASLDGAVQERAFRRTELNRAQSLLDRNLASPNIRDQAKAALDRAEAKVDVDQATLDELLTGTRVEEVQQAQAALAQSQAVRDRLQIDLQRHAARAPQSGVVDSLILEPGERPLPGQALAILLAGEQPYARVYVPEAMRVSTTPGDRVQVHIDGRAAALSGRVRWVSAEASFTPYFALTEHDRGRLSYVAKIDIDYDGERLPDGVPVQVTLD